MEHNKDVFHCFIGRIPRSNKPNIQTSLKIGHVPYVCETLNLTLMNDGKRDEMEQTIEAIPSPSQFTLRTQRK